MHFLLIYAVVEHYVERQTEFRAAHLALARAARAFAQSDPYVQNGLVPHWRIRRWNTVALGEP